MKYLVKIEKDGKGYMAGFPDMPEALTGGDTIEETLALAEDALLTAIEIRMDQRQAVPMPAAKIGKGDHVVYVPEIMQAKVLLWNEMLKDKVSKSELARRLDRKEGYVRRLLDPRANVTISSLSEAARAMHRHIEMEIVRG